MGTSDRRTADSLRKGKSYHHGNLRRAILDAALLLIEERGLDGFTMADLARATDVSSGAPYQHFASRTAVLVALAREGLEHYRTLLDEADKSARSHDPLGRFAARGFAHVRFAVRHPVHFRILYSGSELELEEAPELFEVNGVHDTILRELIEDAAESGQVDPRSLELRVLTAQATMHGLARFFVDGHLRRSGIGDDEVEELALAMQRVLGKGLLPRKRRDEPDA